MKKIYTLLFALMFVMTISKAQTGITWSPATTVNTASSGNYHPRLAIDANNNPIVLWGHSQRAMFSRWNGSMFTAPVMLNTAQISVSSDYWMGPQIASKGDTVYVVAKRYPEMPDTNRLFIMRSFNGGMTFSAPIEFGFIGSNTSRFPTVTIDDSGNPVVGYMKFDSTMNGNSSKWVVTKSSDYGTTFGADVLASNWAGGVVCDCCPGTIINAGNNRVAMLYRDNTTNIRDSWAGISNDGGATFTNGYNVDGNNWNLTSCPGSGPDGVVVGDSLYSDFMNGASGMYRAYLNKSSITNMNSVASTLLTGNITGLTVQNYPRMANHGTAVAATWIQVVNGMAQLGLRFTSNINNGFAALWDTVASMNIRTADVAVGNGVVYVVWENTSDGMVHYRKGTFNPSTVGIMENTGNNSFDIYPNPTNTILNIHSSAMLNVAGIISIKNVLGEEVYHGIISEMDTKIDVSKFVNGLYFYEIKGAQGISTGKFMKSN